MLGHEKPAVLCVWTQSHDSELGACWLAVCLQMGRRCQAAKQATCLPKGAQQVASQAALERTRTAAPSVETLCQVALLQASVLSNASCSAYPRPAVDALGSPLPRRVLFPGHCSTFNARCMELTLLRAKLASTPVGLRRFNQRPITDC